MMRLFRNTVVIITIAALMSAAVLSAGCRKKEEPKAGPTETTAPVVQPVPPEVTLNRKGIDLMKAHAYDEAIREFTLAIEKYPKFEVSYSNRAAAFLAQKKFDKAVEDLNKAYSINPNHPVVHYNFATLYSLQNQTSRSLASLNRALELGFDDFSYLEQDPDLDNVRKSREFRKLLEKRRAGNTK
ncbi:MAG: tetratricopeptide repeat protein [Nitrospirae bacterium]|nr:tetratricopeptide repeat protein [Nitrospirota bacterium]